MTRIEALHEIRDLLADPVRWTKGSTGRNIDGEFSLANDSRTVSWCLVGAVHKVCPTDFILGEDVQEELRFTLRKRRCSSGLVFFNDSFDTKHSQVLGLIDRTIKRLEG